MEKKIAPVIKKVYDAILWFLPKLEQFPRGQKFLLGRLLGGESLCLRTQGESSLNSPITYS